MSEFMWNDCEVLLPDADTTVLIALDNGEVDTGFLDGAEWRFTGAGLIEARVTHWADFPEHPGGAQ